MPKNFEKYAESGLESVPKSIAKTGTIEVLAGSQFVTGTNTIFKSDPGVIEGDWIFANGELRRINRILSDTSIYLEEPFSAEVTAGAALKVTKASRAREISVFNSGTAASSLDGVLGALGAGAGFSFAEETMYRGAQRDFPDPVVVDGTIADTSINVFIVY